MEESYGSFKFYLPPEVYFGEGTSRNAGEYASRYGRKVLLVTGRSSARKSGALDSVVPSLESSGCEVSVFDEVEPNPTVPTLTKGGSHARDFGAEVIIGIGGGSPLDAAKGIAILATNEGPPERYFKEGPENTPLPILTVPTTSGTGSEITPYAIVVCGSGEDAKKCSIRTPLIFPKVALVDPELTYSMSPEITADTGMDVVSHALEGCFTQRRTVLISRIAIEAISLVLRHLRQAFDSPEDAEARSGMLMASLLAGVVIAHTGTDLVHSMGYEMTVHLGIPHGRANAILMAHMVRLYSPCDVLGWMCKALGGKGVLYKKAGDFIAREIEELCRDVDIPLSLEGQISKAQLEEWSRRVAFDEKKIPNYYRRPKEEEVRSIYEKVNN